MRRVALAAVLAVGCSLVGAAPPARGDPAPAEIRRAAETLKTRVKAWCAVREDVVYKCSNCGGSGKLRRRQGWTTVQVDCPRCVRGAKVNAEKARVAYFDAHTPAWRAEKANVGTTQAWLDSLATEPARALLRKWSLESVEMVGLTHGIAKVKETRETEQIAPVEYRWVQQADPKTKAPTWYLWTESDGDWGVDPQKPDGPVLPSTDEPAMDGGRKDPEPAAPPAAKGPIPLPPEEARTLEQALAVAGVAPTLASAATESGTLVVRLKVAGVTAQNQLDEAIARSVIPAFRTIFRSRESCSRVTVVFLARYRDRLGAVDFHPYEDWHVARDLFEKIKFDNLSREEALDLFDREQHSHRLDGLVPWFKGDPDVK